MYFNSNIVTGKSPFSSVPSTSTENLRLLENLTQLNDQRSNIQKRISVFIILLVNALERFAYYGLLCNFILYLNKKPLYWGSLDANIIAFIFIGITYFTSLVGGWLSDSIFGKYATICLSFIIYLVGYTLYPILAFSSGTVPNYCFASLPANVSNLYPILKPDDYMPYERTNERITHEPCSWLIIISIVLIGIGSGSVKANLGAFGADQVKYNGQKTVFQYFNWLYWSINLGSLCSLSALAYIQQNINFFIGFLIPFLSLILSFMLFFIARPCYLEYETDKSIMTNIFRVIIDACRTTRNKAKDYQKLQGLSKKSDKLMIDENTDDETRSLTNSVDITNDDSYSKNQPESFLDNAKIRYGGQFDDNLVDDVKSLRNILILFVLLIPYWIIYFQIETTFLMQGLHMKLFNTSSFRIPAAWLSLANQIIIIVMIPFFDKILYPYIKRVTGYEICTKTRIVIGMLFAILSIIVAGVIETKRIDFAVENSTLIQIIDNTTYIASNLSILWQIPQYTLIGLSEVFCSIGGLYYAYSAAPKSMQSIITGLYYLFMGLGSFFSSLILYLFHDIIYSVNDDINCEGCHLDYYFYTLGAIQFVGLVVYFVLDNTFRLTKLDNEVPCSSFKNKNNNSKDANGTTGVSQSTSNKNKSFISKSKRLNYNAINDPPNVSNENKISFV